MINCISPDTTTEERLSLLIETGQVTMSALINERLDNTETFAYLFLMDKITVMEMARYTGEFNNNLRKKMKLKYTRPKMGERQKYSPKQYLQNIEQYKEFLVWKDRVSNPYVMSVLAASITLQCDRAYIRKLAKKGQLIYAGRGLILKQSLNNMVSDFQKSVSPEETAGMLGYSKQYCKGLLVKGSLQYSKYGKQRGRVSLSSIESYQEEKKKHISKQEATEWLNSWSKQILETKRFTMQNLNELIKKKMIIETGRLTVEKASLVALIKSEQYSLNRHEAARMLNTTTEYIIDLGNKGILKRMALGGYDIASINHLIDNKRGLISIEETAGKLKTNESHIRRLIRNGYIIRSTKDTVTIVSLNKYIEKKKRTVTRKVAAVILNCSAKHVASLQEQNYIDTLQYKKISLASIKRYQVGNHMAEQAQRLG